MPSQAQPSAPVLFEISGKHIAIVTLNRPEKRNAINGAVAEAMHAIVEQIEADPQIRVAILASSSPKTFCSGADLSVMAEPNAGGMAHPVSGFAGFVRAKRKKPWIAAVSGVALGGGFEILIACDMRVSSETAEFGLPEVKRGLMAAAGGVPRLPRQIPRAIALELIATGERIGAKRAYELGFLNRLVAEGTELAEAIRLAGIIAENAPVAVREALAVARLAAERTDDELFALTQQAAVALSTTRDSQEGIRAFLEKRAPVWSGE